MHYYERAAIGGNVDARYNLGAFEELGIDIEPSIAIAIEGGNSDSVKDIDCCWEWRQRLQIRQLNSGGYVTKDDYKKALRVYQSYIDSVKSVQRDEAAAANKKYKYYNSLLIEP